LTRTVPLRYNVRSLLRRRRALAMTTAGIAVVVAIFVSMLALFEGLRLTLSDTGDPRNLVVMRRGTLAEPMSVVDREALGALRDLPGVRHDAAGQSLASPETVVLWGVTDFGGKDQQVPMRGVTKASYTVHPGVRIRSGRALEPGKGEAIVGRALAGRFPGLEIGGQFRWGRREWRTVGVFEAGGTAFEGEVWGDLEAVLDDDRRNQYSSITVPTESAAATAQVGDRIEAERRFSLRAQPEPAYYRAQAGSAEPILAAALTVAVLMGTAAIFGALNTMYASLAGRRREIATLRALGFSPLAIATGFILEALMQTLPAGAVGCLLATTVHGHTTSMLSPMTFASVAFHFRVTPLAIGAGMGFAAIIGVVGGTWPATSAARVPIVQGIRG
jgi:putative ABC transport system permease protein